MRSRRLPRLPARVASTLGAALAVVVLAPGPDAPAAASIPAADTGSSTPVWTWPVAPPHPVVRPYLAPPTPYGAGHRGIDIGAADGTPVLAPDDGAVHFAGVIVDRPVLSIEHAGGVLSSFEPVTSTLHTGDVVHRGEVIGTLVAGHCAASPCLHLGARVDGEYVNPLVFLGGVPKAVLYPTRGG